MPVKARVAKGRHPTFSAETIALFVELDAAPARGRHSQAFKAKERELARQLDLASEYWTINSVLDRSAALCHSPSCAAYQDWFRCRQVRDELLATVRGRRTNDKAANAAALQDRGTRE